MTEEKAQKDKTAQKGGWWARLKQGLGKSSSSLSTGLADLVTKRKLDEGTLDGLEELLITQDLGVEAAMRIREAVAGARFGKDVSEADLKQALAGEITRILQPCEQPLDIPPGGSPHVMLFVGVNGTGKTTTIGKLAARLRGQGKSVMVGAGDTFRAAAVEQLQVWGERAGVPVITGREQADPASVAFDAMDRAGAAGTDVLIVDTAGRLQNRRELMDELAKVVRVLKKRDENAPHETLLVIDATTGQNALRQVEVFREAVNVTGLIVTKLDGSARGGVIVACAEKFGLPVYFVGVGEALEDLQPFRAEAFSRALVGLESEEKA